METVTNSFVLDHFFCKKLLQEIAYNLSGSISDLPRYQKLCSEQNLTYDSSNLAAFNIFINYFILLIRMSISLKILSLIISLMILFYQMILICVQLY